MSEGEREEKGRREGGMWKRGERNKMRSRGRTSREDILLFVECSIVIIIAIININKE